MNYINRVLKQVKLLPDEWDQMIEDYRNGETKGIMILKYNLNTIQYKTLRKHFIGR